MEIYTPDSSKVVHSTKVDFITRPITNPIHLVQYDDTLPIIEVTLYSNGQLYTIPSTADVNVRFGKGDGTMVYNPVLGWDSNRHIVYIEVTQQMTAVKGNFNPVVEINYDDGVVNSGYFNVIIDRNPIQEGDIESTDEYRTIQHIADEAVEAVMEIINDEVAPVYKGNYDASTTYKLNDIVQYNNAVYWHKGSSDTTGVAPTDTSVWGIAIPGGAVDDTLTEQGVAADSKAVGDIKADKDGYYETLSVGRADNIISDVEIVDRAPYSIRPTGGGLEVGDTVKQKMLCGITAAIYQRDTLSTSTSTSANGWQQVNTSYCVFSLSGRTYTITSKTNSNATKNARSTKAWINNNHVIFACADIFVSDSSTYAYMSMGTSEAGGSKINFFPAFQGPTNGFVHKAAIARASYSGSTISRFFLRLNNGAPNGSYAQFRELQVIDLTVALGEELADYILSLETANTGSGVEMFRKIFPYKYYNGSLDIAFRSLSTDKKICVGFNAYDSTANKAKVVPNQAYKIEGNYTSYTYTPLGSTVTTTVLYSDTNASNPTFDFAGEVVFTGADGDLCMHLQYDGSRDGEKEPYRAREYKFHDNLNLKGVFKVDPNTNDIYTYGDTYAPDGTLTRRFTNTTVNDQTWTYDSTNGVFYASIDNMKLGGEVRFTQSYTKYIGSFDSMPEKTYWNEANQYSSTNFVVKTTSSTTTVEAFLSGFDGISIYYELATPVVEAKTPYHEIELVDRWETEEYVDYSFSHGGSNVCTPYGHVSSYLPDLKAKVEASPNLPTVDGSYILKRENGVFSYAPITENVFHITLTQSGSDFTVNKTYEEILDAFSSGKRLLLFVDNITSDGENFVSGYAELSGYIPSITNFNPSFKFVVYFEEYYIAYVVSISLDTNDDTIVSIYGASI